MGRVAFAHCHDMTRHNLETMKPLRLRFSVSPQPGQCGSWMDLSAGNMPHCANSAASQTLQPFSASSVRAASCGIMFQSVRAACINATCMLIISNYYHHRYCYYYYYYPSSYYYYCYYYYCGIIAIQLYSTHIVRVIFVCVCACICSVAMCKQEMCPHHHSL